MDTLRTYLNSLPVPEQHDFARRCQTTLGYLRKALYKGQRLGEKTAILVERESAGRITCEQLRPDVDWAYLRGTKCPGPAEKIISTTRAAYGMGEKQEAA